VTPVRTYLDQGFLLAGGTDSSVVPLNPWWAMYHFITRDTISDGVYGPDERVLGVYATLARARDGSVRLPTAATALRDPTALASALALFTARGPRFEAGILSALARTPRADATSSGRAALPDPLTERETQVLELLVEGLTNREIGERLILGTRTVETHVERILGKLGVGSRTRAIAAALRLRLVRT